MTAAVMLLSCLLPWELGVWDYLLLWPGDSDPSQLTSRVRSILQLGCVRCIVCTQGNFDVFRKSTACFHIRAGKQTVLDHGRICHEDMYALLAFNLILRHGCPASFPFATWPQTKKGSWPCCTTRIKCHTRAAMDAVRLKDSHALPICQQQRLLVACLLPNRVLPVGHGLW